MLIKPIEQLLGWKPRITNHYDHTLSNLRELCCTVIATNEYARYHNSMTIPRKRFRTIGANIEKIVKPIFGRRGFGATTIVNNWVDVVGPVLARHTFPQQISYPMGSRLNGTLHLRINSSAIALELQHLTPQLLDKINTYFGYRAISRLKIVQGPIPEKEVKKQTPRTILDADEKRTLERKLNLISDRELKAALSNLGSLVMHDNYKS